MTQTLTDVLPASPPTITTPLDALLTRAEAQPNATAIIVGDETWICHRIASASERLAARLHALGVSAGDRVAIHMPNSAEAVLAYVACWRLGAIAVPVNIRYKTPEIAAVVERGQPVVFLGHAQLYEAAQPLPETLVPQALRFVVGLPRGTERRSRVGQVVRFPRCAGCVVAGQRWAG